VDTTDSRSRWVWWYQTTWPPDCAKTVSTGKVATVFDDDPGLQWELLLKEMGRAVDDLRARIPEGEVVPLERIVGELRTHVGTYVRALRIALWRERALFFGLGVIVALLIRWLW